MVNPTAIRLLWRNIALPSAHGSARRALHSSASRSAISKFTMPAMSPTMTEGGLATWKVKEGQAFAAGDVLLEIETDKATMDVEAQDDGVMAKIVVEEGAKAVPVGKVIAMLAEEGDDISNVEVPKDEGQSSQASAPPSEPKQEKPSEPASTSQTESKTASAPAVQHTHAPDLGRPQFPSVNRLLIENHISADDARKIKGTGMHGMLTKGDVLAHLGKASSPTGSYTPSKGGIAALGGPPSGGAGAKAQKSEPLTDNDVRTLIFGGLAAASHSARTKEVASQPAKTNAVEAMPSSLHGQRSAFDELLDDYDFGSKANKGKKENAGAGKDSWKGLL